MARKNNYWLHRIQEESKKQLRQGNKETQAILRKLYHAESQTLFNRLLKTFSKIQKDKGEEGKIYLNDLYLTNKYYSLIEEFNRTARRIGAKQVPVTEQAIIDIYKQANETISALAPATTIPAVATVAPVLTLEQRAEQAVTRTWCIDGKNFSERIWTNKEALVQDLTKSMLDYSANGTTPYELSQNIVKRLAVDESNAYRLVRTELAHFQVASQTEKYKEMGFTHGIFRSEDPCDNCKSHDGNTYTLDELESLIPLHPNCECSFDLVV